MAKSLRSNKKTAFRALQRSRVTDYSETDRTRTLRLAEKLKAGSKQPKVKDETKEEDVEEPAMETDEPAAPPAKVSTSEMRGGRREQWRLAAGKGKKKPKTAFTKSKRSQGGKIRA